MRRSLGHFDNAGAAAVASAVGLALAARYGWLGRSGPSSATEAVAVVLYGYSVWLAVTNSILTWPTGIVATGLYLYLFYEWKLYADAGLQVIYIAFSVAGLWAWQRRAERAQANRAERIPGRRRSPFCSRSPSPRSSYANTYLLSGD